MTDLHERQLVDQIDREVTSSHGLVALVLCLSLAVGLAIAGGLSILGAL
jgi:hypothetical protein